ncbi:MAG: glucose 1-dehydrogenase [Deltaproteobacteria bacterium]|nr:MAG: glucose 1-dehydrogenase [Deltaproteobacteria bacterium]
MTPSFSLSGKVAIVTGASRGIGEAIARAFVASGARVLMSSRKIEASAAAALGSSAQAFAAHTGQEPNCIALVAEAIRVFGKVDVLVNNAGTNPYFGPLIEAPMPAWDKTFEVNLKGYFWTAREVARHLAGRNAPGSIVNISSVNGLRGAPLQGVYAMTKAAVISLTRTLAAELGPGGIRVNAIAPGLVDTRLASALVKDEALSGEWLQRTPLKRVASPDEIAGAALYLASEASSFVTGEVLVVDGGTTIA